MTIPDSGIHKEKNKLSLLNFVCFMRRLKIALFHSKRREPSSALMLWVGDRRQNV